MTEASIRRVDKYDGQLIYKDGQLIYDLGNYLGGGAAGSVYQGIGYPNEKQVAVKVLKPIGFKLLPSAQLRSCTPILKGKSLSQVNSYSSKYILDSMYFHRINVMGRPI